MFTAGIKQFINDYFGGDDYAYSEIIWANSVAFSATSNRVDINMREQSVDLIITHQLLFRPTSSAATVSFSDNKQVLFSFDLTGIQSIPMVVPFIYIFQEGRLYLSTNNANLTFAVSYQTISRKGLNQE